jgi:dipeptidase
MKITNQTPLGKAMDAKLALSVILTIASALAVTSSALGCYAVIVGKGASSDGSVIFGHNEQNGGRRIINLRVIPRIRHKPGEMVRLLRGGSLPEVEETFSFIWSENPGLEFSDTYINEWGVAVASDSCPTKETRGEIVEGGIGYMLRRLIIQRARSAREGVRIAGELIDRFGYVASGRTLVIADPNEAWLLSMVRGKHWVARRVPDDEVAFLPNVHIITEIDLNDERNFMGSPDIIEYAIKRGWFDPKNGKPFSFREVYNISSNRRDLRQWIGLSLVSMRMRDLPRDKQLPFSVKPDRKLGVKDVIDILRYHGPKGSICTPSTQEASVFQLRSWLPPEIGCIYWRTSGEPCCSVLIPWYLGITETPESYYKPVDVERQLSLSHHFNPSPGTFEYDPKFAWWTFKRLQDIVNEEYEARIKRVRAVWGDFEAREFKDQPSVEEEALKLYFKDRKGARRFLTEYSRGLALKAAEVANGLIRELMGDLQTGVEGIEVKPERVERSRDFHLLRSYPNPFSSETMIVYEVSEGCEVRICIYASGGELIRTLVDGKHPPGKHSTVWDGRDDKGQKVGSGVYFCRMMAGGRTVVRKLALIRRGTLIF